MIDVYVDTCVAMRLMQRGTDHTSDDLLLSLHSFPFSLLPPSLPFPPLVPLPLPLPTSLPPLPSAGVSTLDIRTRLRISEAELAIVQREVADLHAEKDTLETNARLYEESWIFAVQVSV